MREPLAGDYNTMEFNIPNRTGTRGGSFATSQDVGLNQPVGFVGSNPPDSNQINCTVTAANSVWPIPANETSTVLSNPMNILEVNGGARLRAIGIGQELGAVRENTSSSLGYGFWSAANFAIFSGATSAKYYKVDGVDPLGAAGVIPTTSSELASVSLSTTADGQYPIWSMLRLVNVGTTQNTALADLSAAVQNFVTSGHPDFVTVANMQVVRSHFTPPAQTVVPANGSSKLGTSPNNAPSCTTAEAGGDVGGVVIGLKPRALTQSPLTLSDQTYCQTTSPAGQTGYRR